MISSRVLIAFCLVALWAEVSGAPLTTSCDDSEVACSTKNETAELEDPAEERELKETLDFLKNIGHAAKHAGAALKQGMQSEAAALAKLTKAEAKDAHLAKAAKDGVASHPEPLGVAPGDAIHETMKVGTATKFFLAGNPTTGYEIEAKLCCHEEKSSTAVADDKTEEKKPDTCVAPADVLKLVDAKYNQNAVPDGFVGVGGTYEFDFHATKVGRVGICFESSRSDDELAEGDLVARVDVDVVE